MKYYIIAGEASGDLHGSNLTKAIFNIDPEAHIFGWGGELMQEKGVILRKHYRDLAFMGFLEVILNLKTIFRNLDYCKKDILEFQPDALILIDYPGFNLRIAKWAKQQGIRVYYYISPQVWAWKKSRVKAIKRDITRMFVILPFEKEFYANNGLDVEYVGHPLMDALMDYAPDPEGLGCDLKPNLPILALLPGSRRQEIRKVLPIMLAAASEFMNSYNIIIAAVPSQPASFYSELIGNADVHMATAKTYQLLSSSNMAFVTSGTATLETCLFGVPQIVCYKGSWLSFQIARRLVKIPYISLVNLIAGREVVKELVQHNLTKANLLAEADLIRIGGEKRDRMVSAYKEIHSILGQGGASAKVAQRIYSDL